LLQHLLLLLSSSPLSRSTSWLKINPNSICLNPEALTCSQQTSTNNRVSAIAAGRFGPRPEAGYYTRNREPNKPRKKFLLLPDSSRNLLIGTSKDERYMSLIHRRYTCCEAVLRRRTPNSASLWVFWVLRDSAVLILYKQQSPLLLCSKRRTVLVMSGMQSAVCPPLASEQSIRPVVWSSSFFFFFSTS
jgi:hypothetical protein